MDQTVAAVAITFSEMWYQLLFRAPFLGYLGAGTLAWRGLSERQHTVLAVSLAGASLFWHKMRTAALCLKLTPNIRSICKPICKAFANQAANAHNVRFFDHFTQRTTRFLFEPNENFWQNFERNEIRTILPDGSLETQSWLRRGKGLCTFTQAADLDRGQDIKAEAPYTFLRDDHTKAVVQVWTKMVDQSLGNAWDMEHIHEERAAELLTGGELIAYNDFHKVLNDLLGNAARQGRILKCTERQETFNDHISIEGQLGDVLNTLETNPWTARHYFRCVVERPGIQANRGFVKDNLPFYPGKMETRVVMYIRQGAKQHACFQTFETFALDTRRASNAFSEIAGKFGRFLIADTIGKGGAGVVYKVRALEGKYQERMTRSFALKLARMRRNEQDLEKEVRIAGHLQHKFIVNIYECCEMFLPRPDLDGVWPSTRGILMELADNSLEKEVLEQATPDGKELDFQWLQECRIWMAQMVCAVHYMHGKGVVHRDLKPQNVLLMHKFVGVNSNQKDIKLTDFGIAVDQVQSPNQQLSERCGTRGYLPPEMVLNKPYSMKCDVYSLGMTFASILQRRSGLRKGYKFPTLLPESKLYLIDPLDTLLESMRELEEDRPRIDEIRLHPFFGEFDYDAKRFETINWIEMEGGN